MSDLAKQIVLCDVCGEDSGRELAIIDGERIVRCVRCGLAYLNPRESAEVLARRDEEYYGAGEILEATSHFNIGSVRAFEDTLRAIQRLRPSGALLDIGCGGGFFLRMARDRGYVAHGVEVDEDGCRFARRHDGLFVVHGTLFSAGYAAASFDAITVLNVLEHTDQPTAVLAEAWRLLKPGGVIVITVPNLLFGLGLLRMHALASPLLGPNADFRGKFAVFQVPEHQYFFSPATLESMLERAGFARIALSNAVPVDNPGRLAWTTFKHLMYWTSRAITAATGGRVVPSYSFTALAQRPPD